MFFKGDTNTETFENGDSVGLVNENVEIIDFKHKKNVFGKWVVSGQLNNHSKLDIEIIEFSVEFTDNTEFIEYTTTVLAEEKNHEFSFKVTGHKGETLKGISIRTVTN